MGGWLGGGTIECIQGLNFLGRGGNSGLLVIIFKKLCHPDPVFDDILAKRGKTCHLFVYQSNVAIEEFQSAWG